MNHKMQKPKPNCYDPCPPLRGWADSATLPPDPPYPHPSPALPPRKGAGESPCPAPLCAELPAAQSKGLQAEDQAAQLSALRQVAGRRRSCWPPPHAPGSRAVPKPVDSCGNTHRGCEEGRVWSAQLPEGANLHREGEMLSQSICPARAGVRGPQEVGAQTREAALLPSATRWQQRAPCLCPSEVPSPGKEESLGQSSSPSLDGLLHPPTSQLTATVHKLSRGRHKGPSRTQESGHLLVPGCQHPCSHKLRSPSKF